ncbi:hypothetical protein AB4Z48_17725 [Cupriavidus sp. 2TAF22]|uniref:hypothetical protein n=1 Tax=unclassified Cupriavidus TaxID=2640874 RepID=UPI003F8ED55A
MSDLTNEDNGGTVGGVEDNGAEAARIAAEQAAAAEAAAKKADRAAVPVKARVLVDCEHGAPNQVVTLPKAVALAAEKAGVVDTAKEAVAYAESIAQG